MENINKKLESLLSSNTDEQLAGVDWEDMATEISARLDSAKADKTDVLKFPALAGIVSAVAAAAAIVFIAVVIKTSTHSAIEIPAGSTAAVKIIQTRATAVVKINHPANKSYVSVDIGSGRSKLAKCDVKVFDLNGDFKKKTLLPSWVIISVHKPVVADNGFDRDMMDLICLL